MRAAEFEDFMISLFKLNLNYVTTKVLRDGAEKELEQVQERFNIMREIVANADIQLHDIILQNNRLANVVVSLDISVIA